MVGKGSWPFGVGSDCWTRPPLFLYSCCAPGLRLRPVEPQRLITQADPPPQATRFTRVFVWLLKCCGRCQGLVRLAFLSVCEE